MASNFVDKAKEAPIERAGVSVAFLNRVFHRIEMNTNLMSANEDGVGGGGDRRTFSTGTEVNFSILFATLGTTTKLDIPLPTIPEFEISGRIKLAIYANRRGHSRKNRPKKLRRTSDEDKSWLSLPSAVTLSAVSSLLI